MLLCERNFRELKAFAAEEKLPIGFDVESVSIRKAEIDAATPLFRLARGPGTGSLAAVFSRECQPCLAP